MSDTTKGLSKEEKKALKQQQAEKDAHYRKLMGGRETWVTSYEGHEIKVVYGSRIRLYVDGVEATKQKMMLETCCTLSAPIADTGKFVFVVLESAADFANTVKRETEFLTKTLGLNPNLDLEALFKNDCESTLSCRFYFCDAVPKESISHGFMDKKTEVFTELNSEDWEEVMRIKGANEAGVLTAITLSTLLN